jgi:hypothetical protein
MVAVPLFGKKSLKCKITPIKSESKRFCAVTINIADTMFLLVNAYMPCDNTENNSHYNYVLNEICNSVNSDHVVCA